MGGMSVSLALFAAGSIVLIWFSRKPLRHPGSHGFYRFFAWESMLALAVLNRREWDMAPQTLHQTASRLLMLTSFALVLAALYALHRKGAIDRGRGDGALYGWEKTSRLVTHGIFRFIRHPMYASLLALDWALFLQSPSWLGWVLALIATYFLLRTAWVDERECLDYFGTDYADYCRRTRRFIPGVY